ncbi:hypothetical protein [Chitinophaga nivalis]|uniref:Uncharacterized protein n=1 Tax=Chitinophaga nivalis TaxID=2991709 RepID=A0ABT3IN07_9BACT|nr:hypothetical protein [Chitinophaga nivalis]MCW3465138.1 hypothetical protein [Chitinophaga nivalis]MCW3485170.1 hypothetical protein [Chitinophaga nivalis]
MSAITWNNGQLITMGQGDTATCTGGLNQGQIYGLFFYNYAENDADTNVVITGNNSLPPVTITVPGTTSNQGLAAVCFVSGDDTSTIAAAILNGSPGASIQAFIGSVKMPLDPTGINNVLLPLDGKPHSFTKFTRYAAVPASHWYAAQITSNINAFVSVQFTENTATLFCVNAPANGLGNAVQYYGNTVQPKVSIKNNAYQSITWNLSGNGSQTVWINADSVQNSQQATISVQSLTELFS